MYHFLGNERLQLWFYSPNVCAAFLAMTILLAVGIFLWLPRRHWREFIPAGLLAVFIVGLELLLAKTYSRGGFVALLAGFVAAWLLLRRRATVGFGLTAVGMVLLVSNGVDRVRSMAEVSDGSIANRFRLWRGAAGIIERHWLSGINAPGELYRAWYLPLSIDEHTRTMINDYLTLAAKYGIWAVFLYLACFALPFWLGLRFYGRKGGAPALFAGAFGALVAYFVSASFSTMYEHDELFWFALALLVPSAGWLLFMIRRRRSAEWFDAVVPLGGALLVCLALLVWGWRVNRTLPAELDIVSVNQIEEESYRVWRAVPPQHHGRQIVYLFENGLSSESGEVIWSTVRPFLARNEVITVAQTDGGFGGLAHAEQVLAGALAEHPDWPLVLFGQGAAGKQAIIAAAKNGSPQINGVVVLDAPASWPFEGLSALEFVDRCPGRLLLLYAADDDAATVPEEVDILAAPRLQRGLPVERRRLPEAGLIAEIERFAAAVTAEK